MSTILCLIAGLLIFICCWFAGCFAAYIYEEDVTECSGAIDYVPASVARQLETELAAAIARAEHAEALIRALCKICSTPIGATQEASK